MHDSDGGCGVGAMAQGLHSKLHQMHIHSERFGGTWRCVSAFVYMCLLVNASARVNFSHTYFIVGVATRSAPPETSAVAELQAIRQPAGATKTDRHTLPSAHA